MFRLESLGQLDIDLFTFEPDKPGEVMFLFNFFGQSGIWKVPCDRFILHEITTYGIKRGTL